MCLSTNRSAAASRRNETQGGLRGFNLGWKGFDVSHFSTPCPNPPTPSSIAPTPPGTVQASALAYAELAVATNFSFCAGRPIRMNWSARAAELGYRAIGVTDLNSLAGVVRMHVAAKAGGAQAGRRNEAHVCRSPAAAGLAGRSTRLRGGFAGC